MSVRRDFFAGLGLGFASVLGGAALGAAPFRVSQIGDMRADGRLDWASFSPTPGTVVPNFAQRTAQGLAAQLTVVGDGSTTMSIAADGAERVLLNTGAGAVTIFSSVKLQGFGLQIDHTGTSPATYALEYFTSEGILLGSVQAAAGSGVNGAATFLGVVDPEARIGAVRVLGAPGNSYTLGDPVLQVAPPSAEDFPSLPTSGTVSLVISPLDTYLHEGLRPARRVASTSQATLDNSNAHDLLAVFPTLAAGDLLRFERRGYALEGGFSINATLGVLTATPVIAENTAFRRLSSALDTGRDFNTPTSSSGAFATGTNIAEDFFIGSQTFVTVPHTARYLMLSLARPGLDALPQVVQVSHVRRQIFADWLAARGLHGANAQPAADLDGDGLSVLEEFAFQKDPTVPDARPDLNYAFAPKLGTRAEDGRIALVFGARLYGQFHYTAEFSPDLVNWTARPLSAVAPILIDGEGNRALFQVFDTQTGPRRFGRIRVHLTPPPAP
jgi:hypothetical protein